MKILHFILDTVCLLFFSSADMHLFGSRKRRKEKAKMSKRYKGYATDVQSEIDELKNVNPFESAAAKSAMATASRRANQAHNRYANMMGANASPEAIIAAQGATQNAIAGAVGDIAVGSEALKKQELSQLRAEKMALMGQSAGLKQASINEIGKGWAAADKIIRPLAGGIAEGLGAASE